MKGSTLGRTAKAKEKSGTKETEDKKTVILKDLDIKDMRRKLILNAETAESLMRVLLDDVTFLAVHNVMDYSFFFSICEENIREEQTHHCTCCGAMNMAMSRCDQCNLEVCPLCYNAETGLQPCHICYGMDSCPYLGKLPNTKAESDKVDANGSMFRRFEGGFKSNVGTKNGKTLVYYVGIIDFLQPYNLRKELESSFKTIFLAQGDELKISVLEPFKYANRMLRFVNSLIEPPTPLLQIK